MMALQIKSTLIFIFSLMLPGFLQSQPNSYTIYVSPGDSIFTFEKNYSTGKSIRKLVGVGSTLTSKFVKVTPLLIKSAKRKVKRVVVNPSDKSKEITILQVPVPARNDSDELFENISSIIHPKKVKFYARKFKTLKNYIRYYNDREKSDAGVTGGSFFYSGSEEQEGAVTDDDEELLKFKESYDFATTALLNSFFERTGFLDTTSKLILNRSRLSIEAELKEVTMAMLQNTGGPGVGYANLDLKIEWKFQDRYENTVFSMQTSTLSDIFSITEKGKEDSLFASIWFDALEASVYKILASDQWKTKAVEYRKEQKAYIDSLNTIYLTPAKEGIQNFRESLPSVVTLKGPKGHGTGFYITEDGYLITNYHVIANNEPLKINNDSLRTVNIVRWNKEYDLALLKVSLEMPSDPDSATVAEAVPDSLQSEEKTEQVSMKKTIADTSVYKPLVLRSKIFPEGTDVYAVGTPFDVELEKTITAGIVSAVRKWESVEIIQTDVSINPGNSGGPLMLKNGEVIGVVSSKYFGVYVEGIGFALPVKYISEGLKISFSRP